MLSHVVDLLRCPICGGRFSKQGNSLVCAKRHCFDIARQGHVNLAPAQKDAFYTKELFASRAKAFEASVYDRVIDAITEAIEQYAPQDCALTLVDAGCGEGFYTRSVCPKRSMTRIGFDLSKEAVRLAAREKSCAFFVGDLAAIPLAEHCCDVLLDVFTPANYAQFKRILKPGGLLIKLAPRSGYLRELRQAAADQLRHADYDGGKVERYVLEHVQLLEQRTITYTMDIEPELVPHLARMTPMLAGVERERLDLSGIRTITLDETMYVGIIR